LQAGSGLLLWGGFAYLALPMPTGLAASADRKLATPRRGSIAVALIATIAILPLRAADVGGGWAEAFDPVTLRALSFETRVGFARQCQTVAAIALALTNLLPSPTRRLATAAAAGLLLATLALTGHTVSETGELGIVHRFDDAMHLLCGGAWLGALPPLLFTLAALKNPALREEVVTALRRFSSAGHVAVAGVIATCAVTTWLVLRHASIDLASPYQRLLLCKLALVAAMVIHLEVASDLGRNSCARSVL